MDKWLLLIVSLAAIYVVVEAIRWHRMIQRSSTRDVEKIVGYDGSSYDPFEREKTADRMKYDYRGVAPIKLVWLLLAIAMGLIAATVRAFLSAE
jgi:hypothetical protein